MMDGYAVRAADLERARPESPVTLQLRGRIAAGETFASEISPGECVRIFTGSPLPAGADAVIMQEDTRPDPSGPAMILFLDAVKPWENVRFRGEDLKRGAIIAEPGALLTAGRLSLLAAAGVTRCHRGKMSRRGPARKRF